MIKLNDTIKSTFLTGTIVDSTNWIIIFTRFQLHDKFLLDGQEMMKLIVEMTGLSPVPSAAGGNHWFKALFSTPGKVVSMTL